jgi:hypothetical protein
MMIKKAIVQAAPDLIAASQKAAKNMQQKQKNVEKGGNLQQIHVLK